MSGPVYFIGLDAYGNETSVTVPIVALIAGNTGEWMFVLYQNNSCKNVFTLVSPPYFHGIRFLVPFQQASTPPS